MAKKTEEQIEEMKEPENQGVEERKSGEVIMAIPSDEINQPRELAFLKVSLLQLPTGQRSINIEGSKNITYGMALDMLEATAQKLKQAPVNY